LLIFLNLELLLLALALVALSLSVGVIFSLDFLTPDKVEIVRIRVHFQTVFSVISIFLKLIECRWSISAIVNFFERLWNRVSRHNVTIELNLSVPQLQFSVVISVD